MKFGTFNINWDLLTRLMKARKEKPDYRPKKRYLSIQSTTYPDGTQDIYLDINDPQFYTQY